MRPKRKRLKNQKLSNLKLYKNNCLKLKNKMKFNKYITILQTATLKYKILLQIQLMIKQNQKVIAGTSKMSETYQKDPKQF